jgi:mono/diheme cytochrome c family protein
VAFGLGAALAVASGCGGGADSDDPVVRGRAAYLANCVACHSTNPKLAGPIGPALAGVPREVVWSKVMRNEYPPGYTPKRSTRAMVPLPHLEPKLDDVAAYLGSLKAPSLP